MTKEQEVLHLMKSLDLSREEAEQLWQDDHDDYESDEMKEMAANAKKNGLLKTGARQVVDPSGKKKVRERKPNEDKRALVAALASCLEDCHRRDEDEPVSGVVDVQTVNPERQVDFHLNGVHYSVTLTAHRPPKAKK